VICAAAVPPARDIVRVLAIFDWDKLLLAVACAGVPRLNGAGDLYRIREDVCMRVLALAIGAAMVIGTQAAATDARLERSLQLLTPSERLLQLCDYTAMNEIRKDKDARHFRPDRTVAGAISEPQLQNDTVTAMGAAFRSRGKWFAVSYSCTGTSDHMKIVSFHYKIGAEIPMTKWAAYGLFQ
jgi:hypothetical protein